MRIFPNFVLSISLSDVRTYHQPAESEDQKSFDATAEVAGAPEAKSGGG
jgi:hypothetical protein